MAGGVGRIVPHGWWARAAVLVVLLALGGLGVAVASSVFRSTCPQGVVIERSSVRLSDCGQGPGVYTGASTDCRDVVQPQLVLEEGGRRVTVNVTQAVWDATEVGQTFRQCRSGITARPSV